MLQELEKWAPSYIAALNTVSPDQPVRMLLDACRVPSVVECCGQEGIGATVLGSAVQVALFSLLFYSAPFNFQFFLLMLTRIHFSSAPFATSTQLLVLWVVRVP
jgi:hypothetical protein